MGRRAAAGDELSGQGGRASAPDLLLYYPHQRAHPRDHPLRVRPQPHVHRRDRGHRPALLPVHRGQGEPLPGQEQPPDLRRTGGSGHLRAVPQRHFHQPAVRYPAGGGAFHPWFRERQHHTARLRHRIRLLQSPGPQAQPGDQAHARAVLRRPDQRHHRLRGSRRPGVAGGPERGPAEPGKRGLDAAPRRSLRGRAGGRPDHHGHPGALPHVHQPRRIPAAAARGQRRPAPHRERPRAGPGGRRALGGLRGQARRHGA